MADPVPAEPRAAASPAPLIVHGLDLSYFTGKLEGYLRLKAIPYRLQEMDTASFRALGQRTGVRQMPQLERPDGAVWTDTPVILDRLEAEVPAPSLSPDEPAAAFAAHLLEAYGDEWLWRPALYYRWAFDDDARLMAGRIAGSMLRDVAGPFWLKRAVVRARQRRVYLREDGVTRATAPRVAALYPETLAAMEAALRDRPFLTGDRPTRADVGFFGPMFRHFACDPTPAALMRAQAPRVVAWVGRIWSGAPGWAAAAPPVGLPQGLEPIVRAIGEGFLPYLAANAAAVSAGARVVDWTEAGVAFRTPASPYRAFRLDRLRRQFQALPPDAAAAVAGWIGPPVSFLAAPAAMPPAPDRHVRDRAGNPMKDTRKDIP